MKSSRISKIILIAFICFGVIAPFLGVREYAHMIKDTIPTSYNSTADCGVVLTGGAGRVREGLAVLSRGQIKTLIISGVHQHTTLADMVPEVAFYPEVDLDKVILERRSNSTASNAQQSLVLVDALGCKSILLMTSDYHMHRAYQTFEHYFPPTLPITPYVVPSDRKHGAKLWLTAFDEFVKFIFYEVILL